MVIMYIFTARYKLQLQRLFLCFISSELSLYKQFYVSKNKCNIKEILIITIIMVIKVFLENFLNSFIA